MSLRNGIIDDEMLRALLSSKAIPKAEPSARSTDTIHLRKSEIATMLLKAIPTVAEDMPLNELLQILTGLASTLSMIGMDRKQAFILKELLQRTIPGLVEARKVGAAEIGIHPAAGLLGLSNASHSGFLRIEEGMKSLLTLVGAMYAALDERADRMSLSNEHNNSEGSRLIASRRAQLLAHGSFDLKVDVLKSCIAICEILPDFEGVLSYTVYLLNLSRGAILLPFHQPCEAPAISQEEQTRLMDSIKRTVGAAAKVGIMNIQADYWDDFLIRGIEAIDSSPSHRVTPHSKKELQSVTESHDIRADPFIYNPFSKQNSCATDRPLVADELAYFHVCLQNPFEIDVEIDEISLLAEGCDFQPSKHSIVLGHFCCQKFTMVGTPRKSGTLSIVGCKARIRFCKQRDFHIFSKDWKPKNRSETKRKSYAAGSVVRNFPTSAEVEFAHDDTGRSNPGPEAVTISLTVLNAQPRISIQSTTLLQPALMVLEGEKRSFQINLKNESIATAVDLLLFTFQDSATAQLRAALTSDGLSPTELYELQLQLAGRPPFKHIASDEQGSPAIGAGENAVFTIEVLGIPGLINGVVQVDYAHLGVDPSDVKDKFYTRQITFPVAVTVNAAIEIPRCNMLPFSGDFAWWNKQRASVSSRGAVDTSSVLSPALRSRSASLTPSHTDNGQFTSLLARLGLGSHGHDHCLLLMDLRNVWPFPLSISVQVREGLNASSSPTDPWRRAYTVHESLQPGHVSRAVLLIPRVYVSNPHAPIPLIGNQRQFVVNASKLSAGAEEANREAFWYREELLKHIRGSWREEGTGREGTIDLRRGIRLNAKMIEALKIEDLEITLSIQASRVSGTQLSPALQDGHARFTLQTNFFATFSCRIQNRSSAKKHLLLRIQPSVRDQTHTIALDLSKRFAWTGMLQRVLHPPLAPHEVREANLGIMALCAGKYEIAATVEELKVAAQGPVGRKTDVSSQSNDRRIWHAREPCLVDAVEQTQP
jgi:trafficking protein particle complex subunit 9